MATDCTDSCKSDYHTITTKTVRQLCVYTYMYVYAENSDDDEVM